jgi:serine/threonine-protein kinase TTK/MPS1
MAIMTNGVAIRYASEDLKYKFARLAVSRHGLALQHIPEIIRKDREIILIAVKSDGLAMRYANYIQDREICMTAVINNGLALPFIHCDFAESDEYIMEAIISNCYAIQYVHNTFQTLRMAKIVVGKDAATLQYLRKDLWDDSEVRQVALNPEKGREYAEEFYLGKLVNFDENNSDIDTDSSSEALSSED